MNREDIIRMAQEAGWDDHHAQFDTRFQTFAALVASAAQAKEREACAKLCDDDQSEAGEWTAGAHVGGYFAVRIRARGQA